MLMVVDTVDVVTTTKQCFCEVVKALLQLLLSVDIVDVVLRGNRLRDSVPSRKYCWPKPLLLDVDMCRWLLTVLIVLQKQCHVFGNFWWL